MCGLFIRQVAIILESIIPYFNIIFDNLIVLLKSQRLISGNLILNSLKMFNISLNA